MKKILFKSQSDKILENLISIKRIGIVGILLMVVFLILEYL